MSNKFTYFILVVCTAFYCLSALADNKSAENCEIFIKNVSASYGSHGSSSMGVTVKVNWLGNDEFIQQVGFWGYIFGNDLGNGPGCSWPNYQSKDRSVINPAPSMGKTAYGEYFFYFPIASGSVVSACRGFTYESVGSFFVRTNKNTYYTNPELNPKKEFDFDQTGFDNIAKRWGTYNPIDTAREEMRYYNPKACR